ncbi:MAG TPA: methylmalonyl-CoA mutase family protein, partial [Chloroflexota bacterium]|nr:methylmalonyl-CoA mutase family protein [Chloroflexota bacterium]
GIEQGFQQAEIMRSAYEYQRKLESGERAVVGVSAYTMEDAQRPAILRLDPAAAERQIERLGAVRERRDGTAVCQSLDALRCAAEGTDNLMTPILDAVRCYATIGEICDTMREVFGEYRDEGVGLRD